MQDVKCAATHCANLINVHDGGADEALDGGAVLLAQGVPQAHSLRALWMIKGLDEDSA